MIRVRAHGPEEVSEAPSLAASRLHHPVLRQHRRALLRRRGRARRVATTLVVRQNTGRGFHEDSTLRGCGAHPVVGSPLEQRDETAAMAPGRGRRRFRRCRRRR